MSIEPRTDAAPRTTRERALHLFAMTLVAALHLACLLAFVVHFSAGMVALALGGYALRMWAVSTGYHRLFSHHSFKTSRAFQFVLASLGATSLQNGPIWWASWHRRHHRFSDTARDAHSPAHGGFWHAHMGWYLDGSHNHPDLSNVKDLLRFPELRFIERHWWLPPVVYAAACAAIGGVPGLVWGFAISSVLVLHATLMVNSLAHVWGARRFDTADDSRNNAALALLTFGDGWHNNHHRCMSSARHGFAWWEIDVSYYVLRALAVVGVVWDLRPPPRDVLGEPTAGQQAA